MKRTLLFASVILVLLAEAGCGSYSSPMNGAQAATPQFSPAAGSYAQMQPVTITDGTPGVVIYYTTNGSMPTTNSNVYRGPIILTATTTINAMAASGAYSASGVASATYTIAP